MEILKLTEVELLILENAITKNNSNLFPLPKSIKNISEEKNEDIMKTLFSLYEKGLITIDKETMICTIESKVFQLNEFKKYVT